ncbi:MAG: GTP-binding protein [Planctomycetota bacterium]
MAPKFVLIGGFLGAGKSTTVARLAAHYSEKRKRVGIVTNDQTTGLVDTQSLRHQGFDVGEVAGACFCCSFNELTDTVDQMQKGQLPDVILAEPVGSCTDLVATVIRPLENIYAQPLDIAPYGVVLKPSHGLRILTGKKKAGFSPKAAYIFRKQIEESDFVVINRIDELAQEEVDSLAEAIESEYPGRTILRMSAKTGIGFDAYLEFLDQQGQFGGRVIEVDYDLYAEGEAELGWLNSQLKFASETEFSLDEILLRFVSELQEQFKESEAEVAHLKVIGMSDGNYAVANSVSTFTEPVLSLASKCSTKRADLVVNARVATEPSILEEAVVKRIQTLAGSLGASVVTDTMQSFKPSPPVPTHRIAAS